MSRKHTTPKGTVSRSVQNQVLLADDFTCVYCGHRGADVTMDHITPQVRGGRHTLDNLYTSCQPCNSSKNARTPAEAGMVPRYGRFARRGAAPALVAAPAPAPARRPAPAYVVPPTPRPAGPPPPPDRTLADIFKIAPERPRMLPWQAWLLGAALAVALLVWVGAPPNDALLRRFAPAPISAPASR